MEFIQQNIMLVILAVASGSMLLATHFMGAAGSQVTTTEATTMINREDAQIIEVRDAADFSGGRMTPADVLQRNPSIFLFPIFVLAIVVIFIFAVLRSKFDL